MVRGTNHIAYLHAKGVYQVGKVAIEQGIDFCFDTYISMDTKISIRVIEFMIYGIMALIWTTGYLVQSVACVFILILYIVLFSFTV